MGNLVVIEFPEEHTAFAVRAELAKMQKEYLIKMEDVVVVTKDEKGKAKLHQAVNLTMAGAASGGFWGMLIGMIFLNPLRNSGRPSNRSPRRLKRRRAAWSRVSTNRLKMKTIFF